MRHWPDLRTTACHHFLHRIWCSSTSVSLLTYQVKISHSVHCLCFVITLPFMFAFVFDSLFNSCACGYVFDSLVNSLFDSLFRLCVCVCVSLLTKVRRLCFEIIFKILCYNRRHHHDKLDCDFVHWVPFICSLRTLFVEHRASTACFQGAAPSGPPGNRFCLIRQFREQIWINQSSKNGTMAVFIWYYGLIFLLIVCASRCPPTPHGD